MPDAARIEREARRLLDRYLVEVVERWDLCPWASPARRRGEVRVEVLVAPGAAAPDVGPAVERIAHDPDAALGMVVLAASSIDPAALRRVRDAAVRPEVAIADFHPTGGGDLASPARLVPVLRRSPDPMLQVVRWSVLDAARRSAPPPTRGEQARLLAELGPATPRPASVADAVAAANHRAVAVAGLGALLEVLADLARDRAAAYAAAGVTGTSR
jgi:hypothetical protein